MTSGRYYTMIYLAGVCFLCLSIECQTVDTDAQLFAEEMRFPPEFDEFFLDEDDVQIMRG
jgi:hypothetical protein